MLSCEFPCERGLADLTGTDEGNDRTVSQQCLDASQVLGTWQHGAKISRKLEVIHPIFKYMG